MGGKTTYNPKELLLASTSSFHMVWYLHLCSEAKVIVTKYVDNATGIMLEKLNGSGCFKEATLNPVVAVAEKSIIEK